MTWFIVKMPCIISFYKLDELKKPAQLWRLLGSSNSLQELKFPFYVLMELKLINLEIFSYIQGGCANIVFIFANIMHVFLLISMEWKSQVKTNY